MAEESSAHWDGVVRRSAIKEAWAAERDRMSDAAHRGDWPTVFAVLDKQPEWVNSGRLEGRSGYGPLHQAAWHGTDVETVGRLLARGAWRTLRSADGTRAVDIAVQRGHQHLTPLLSPAYRHPLPQDVLDRLRAHLHRLIHHRSGGAAGREDLATKHALRLPDPVVLTELDVPRLWFPVPGMYGGFHIKLQGEELSVDSWVRVVGGSERTDLVTVDGVQLHEGHML
ncbi:ankyrin repeat domain-containing protein [Streptomyces sp. NPDC046909]|uniref:ankyrin repeat domain-containing protein n=1 Tax=Streptomyces sp. NPDC046909 TaxID=3155617 RepID=UPI0033CDA836